jgi:hypothetical protein
MRSHPQRYLTESGQLVEAFLIEQNEQVAFVEKLFFSGAVGKGANDFLRYGRAGKAVSPSM